MSHTLAVICRGGAQRPTFPYAKRDESGAEYDEDGTGNFIFEFDLYAQDVNSAQAQALDTNEDVLSYSMLD